MSATKQILMVLYKKSQKRINNEVTLLVKLYENFLILYINFEIQRFP